MALEVLSKDHPHKKYKDRKKELSESIKETYEGASSAGFDPKIIRLVIKRKKEDREKLEQDELVLKTYEEALDN